MWLIIGRWIASHKAWVGFGVAGAVVIVMLLLAHGDARHWRKMYDGEVAAHALDLAHFREANAQAIAANQTDVRAKESAAAQITEEKQHDLEGKLADARADAARYAGRVRVCPAPAYSGSTGQGGASQAAGPASGSDVSGGMSVVPADDLRICADAVVKARAWPEWYGKVRETYNAQ